MRAKTIICDIDGVILTHLNAGMHSQLLDNPIALKGSVEKLSEWDRLGSVSYTHLTLPTILRV